MPDKMESLKLLVTLHTYITNLIILTTIIYVERTPVSTNISSPLFLKIKMRLQ